MDYNQNSTPNQYQTNSPYNHQEAPRSAFSSVALVFAIGSLLTVMTVYLPLIFGSLAIIFAVLSKGARLKCNITELLTIAISLFSITIVIIAMVAAIYILIMNPQYVIDSIEAMAPMLEQIYGVTADEIIQQFESMTQLFN